VIFIPGNTQRPILSAYYMATEEALIHIAEGITRENIASRMSLAVISLPKTLVERADLVIILSNESYELYMLRVMKQVSRMMEYNYLEYCGIPLLASPCVKPDDIVIKVAGEGERCEIDRLRTLGNRYVIVSEPVLRTSYLQGNTDDLSLSVMVGFVMDAILLSLLVIFA
jgi:hypothetical protein